MGLRSSSLAKKNDDTLTWVLHKKDPSQLQETGQRSNETENENILRKSYAISTTSEYRERKHNDSNNHVSRKRRTHVHSNILDYGESEQTYGYGITDLDDFLSKASILRPGNIPMVLCTGCLLYQTQLDDHYQTEVALPLGMVVNAVFKDQQWLYVQTPHAEEGYIPYGSCLPLGIVPPPDAARAPCWETQSDVFPRPLGDRRRHRHRHHHHHHHHHRHLHCGDDDDEDHYYGGAGVGSNDSGGGNDADGDRYRHHHQHPHHHRHDRHRSHRRRHRRRSSHGGGRWSSVDMDDDDDEDDGVDGGYGCAGGGCHGRPPRLWTPDDRTAARQVVTPSSARPARSVTGYGYL